MSPTAEKTIKVAVCITPTGEVHFTEPNQTSLNTIIKDWRNGLSTARKKELDDAGATGGTVVVTFLATDWFKMKRVLTHG